jgi:Glycosyl transferase family 90
MDKLPPKFTKKGWQGFSIRKVNNQLEFNNYIDYETRNESVFKLIKSALEEYSISDFEWILINTSDRDDFSWLTRRKNLAGKIKDDANNLYNYISTCHSKFFRSGFRFLSAPDFVYDHWKQTGLDDYEDTCTAVRSVGPAATQMLGWRGAETHENRKKLVSLDDKVKFDCEFINWNRSNPEKLTAKNFLTFQEQVEKWRFLIDIEGNGYSGRLKLLLHCPRVIFIQERKYKEDFFESLIPWRHYVPVKNDFSDLKDNIEIILKSKYLENTIIAEANLFASNFLTRNAARMRWAHVLELHALDCMNEEYKSQNHLIKKFMSILNKQT